MADKKEYQTKLAKLTDEEIIFKREYMNRRKQGWANEVLENRERQRSEELERSNKAISDESLALAREANQRSKISNRIKIARIVVIIIVAVIGWLLLMLNGFL